MKELRGESGGYGSSSYLVHNVFGYNHSFAGKSDLPCFIVCISLLNYFYDYYFCRLSFTTLNLSYFTCQGQSFSW